MASLCARKLFQHGKRGQHFGNLLAIAVDFPSSDHQLPARAENVRASRQGSGGCGPEIVDLGLNRGAAPPGCPGDTETDGGVSQGENGSTMRNTISVEVGLGKRHSQCHAPVLVKFVELDS